MVVNRSKIMGGRAGGGARSGRGGGDQWNGVAARITTKAWRQHVGYVDAVTGSDLRVGDTVVWNGGTTSKIVGIENVSAKYIKIQEQYGNNPVSGEGRKFMKTHKFAVKHAGNANLLPNR